MKLVRGKIGDVLSDNLFLTIFYLSVGGDNKLAFESFNQIIWNRIGVHIRRHQKRKRRKTLVFQS